MTSYQKWQVSRTNRATTGLLLGFWIVAGTVFFLAIPRMASAQNQIDTCTGGKLYPNGLSSTIHDLVIDVPCTLSTDQYSGVWKYGVVNIIQGGSLHFPNRIRIIEFWAGSILIQKGGSLTAGEVGKSQIIPFGVLGGRLTIHLYGAEERRTGRIGVSCKEKSGNTYIDDARCGIPDNIWEKANEMTNNPTSCTAVDLPGPVNDCFYKYDTMPYDDGKPDRYFGDKVLAVSYGGTLQLYGYKGALYPDTEDPSNSGTSWLRLNNCNGKDRWDFHCSAEGGVLEPGATTLKLDTGSLPFADLNWRPGDLVVITSTDYLPSHSELRQIAAVSPADSTITLSRGLSFPHNAAVYDLTKKIPRGRGLTDLKSVDTRAAVALLTRSIQIVSGGDSFGKDLAPDSFFGGHVVIRQGFREVQLQGVEFYQLGQGGKMGHYPLHFHMARKVPKDTLVKDCSIWDSMTRWIVVHATQGLLLARNVGYLSIGHGYYLEDGTETNNKLYANIGISARAAVKDAANERKVPGILAYYKETNNVGIPQVPYSTDIDNPTIFWSMNGWNDWEYNMAVGAETCGLCYWMVAGNASGGSRKMKWTGYASEQVPIGHDGTTPIKEFLGNTCSTATAAFNDIADTTVCHGTKDGGARLPPIDNSLLPVPQIAVQEATDRDLSKESFYPIVHGGFRKATLCPSESADCNVDPCDNGHRGSCAVTVLDRFTTSFNWAETNFAAVWLRPLWNLVLNSAITDTLSGGLTFVTGGGYTRSDSPLGMWDLARKSVFIGHTQGSSSGSYALDGGPVNQWSGLSCKNNKGDYNYCLAVDSKDVDQGALYQRSNWAMNQRLFNIYDGPAYQDSNAYLDITPTVLTDCDLSDNAPPKRCQDSKWMEGVIPGVPGHFVGEGKKPAGCYLPNAAIAWKQPNGFYYPPAFHSTNLYFDNVPIRHYVIEPQFEPGTYRTKLPAAQARYCNAESTMFDNFTDVDRQTELNDDDGSLTGLVSTISVNQDDFFSSPTEDIECASDVAQNKAGTAKTSPYDYVTAVVFPSDCSVPKPLGDDPQCNNNPNWYYNCSEPKCYGIPLYRQYLNPGETTPPGPIKMSSQGTGQRETMIPNNGLYYIDTTVPINSQKQFGSDVSVFESNKTYHVFLLFAKPKLATTEATTETFKLYVGHDFQESTLKAETANLNTGAATFNLLGDGTLPSTWTHCYDSSKGILTVQMNMNFDAFIEDYNDSAWSFCQPSSMCSWKNSACRCNITDPNNYLYEDCQADDSAICKWSVKDTDYPSKGAYGFRFTLPSGFTRSLPPKPNPQPLLTGCFSEKSAWNLRFTPASSAVARSCYYDDSTPEPKFCTKPEPPEFCPKPPRQTTEYRGEGSLQ
jgi:hypothetical protein